MVETFAGLLGNILRNRDTEELVVKRRKKLLKSISYCGLEKSIEMGVGLNYLAINDFVDNNNNQKRDSSENAIRMG